MLRIGRQTESAVRLWARSKAWRHHITPVTPDAFPPFLKTSVFDDPVTCSIIENTSPEVYCTFKAACSELKAADAILEHHTRHHNLPDPKRWEAAHRELMPSLTLLATNNGDEAMLKSLPMLPVIALNVTVALHPSYVVWSRQFLCRFNIHRM